jgi:anti-sigma factor ChrR (cupin superfamily)
MTSHASRDSNHTDTAALLAEAVARSLPDSELSAKARVQFMDLLESPRGPVDRGAYAWAEAGPGLKIHVLSEDTDRGLRRCLVWGRPGASTPRHGHSGDEVILVLEGRLKDDRGDYGPGDICRSTSADVHQEQVLGDDDCVCFVLYYGDLVPV